MYWAAQGRLQPSAGNAQTVTAISDDDGDAEAGGELAGADEDAVTGGELAGGADDDVLATARPVRVDCPLA
jgi:hypothetical protein